MKWYYFCKNLLINNENIICKRNKRLLQLYNGLFGGNYLFDYQ